MSDAKALVVDDLSASYGQATALSKISIHIASDEIVGLLGHNGAGKSTLLRSIARVHPAITGDILLDGTSIANESTASVARKGIGLVREGAPVFGHLTVEENLRIGERLAGHRKLEPEPLTDVWSWFPVLEERRGVLAGDLSGGQRQMLAISCALVARPRVLLLDEPSAGLAPSMAAAVFSALRELCSTGMAVLLAEQDLHWVTGFVSRTYRLETGSLVDS
jgi:branched-chain amino acid transport system ATP-binding protein